MHFQTIYVPGFLKQFYTYHDFPRLFLLKSKKISNGHRSKMSFIVEVAVSTFVIGHTNIELLYKFFSNCSIKKYKEGGLAYSIFCILNLNSYSATRQHQFFNQPKI